MTAQEFLDLSTRLFKDLQTWVVEAGKDDVLSSAELETIRSATRVIEGVTLREAQLPDPTGGPTLL